MKTSVFRSFRPASSVVSSSFSLPTRVSVFFR
ncbi:hypothetical protein SHIRM173S_12864 [Streptomyces hirsutus]